MRSTTALCTLLLAALAGGAQAQTTTSLPVRVELSSVSLYLEANGTMDFGQHTNFFSGTLYHDPNVHGGAHVRVHGDAGREVALTFPGSLLLTGEDGASTMQFLPELFGRADCDWQANKQLLTSGGALTLHTDGSYCAWLGGTLTIPENMPAGVYSGDVTMSVAYLQ